LEVRLNSASASICIGFFEIRNINNNTSIKSVTVKAFRYNAIGVKNMVTLYHDVIKYVSKVD